MSCPSSQVKLCFHLMLRNLYRSEPANLLFVLHSYDAPYFGLELITCSELLEGDPLENYRIGTIFGTIVDTVSMLPCFLRSPL